MARIAINPDRWKTNPLNFAPEVTGEWSAPPQIGILDSTVRKVTGTPGAKYNPQDVAELTQLASRLGVRWIEVNLVSRQHAFLTETSQDVRCYRREGSRFHVGRDHLPRQGDHRPRNRQRR